MKKCERCAKSTGLFRAGVPLSRGVLCAPCARDLGFDLKKHQYLLSASVYSDIREGLARFDQLRNARHAAHYEFLVHYDDPAIERRLVKYQKFWSDPDCKYDGLTIREIKDLGLYGEKIYKFAPLDVDVEFELVDGVLRVLLSEGDRSFFIGCAPPRKTKRVLQILSDLDPAVSAVLTGGHFYQLKNNGYVEDEWSDAYKVRVLLDWSRHISLESLDKYL